MLQALGLPIAASPSRKELKSALSDRSDEKGEDCARMLTARFRLIPPLTALERSSVHSSRSEADSKL